MTLFKHIASKKKQIIVPLKDIWFFNTMRQRKADLECTRSARFGVRLFDRQLQRRNSYLRH